MWSVAGTTTLDREWENKRCIKSRINLHNFSKVCFLEALVRDRPFNLKGGGVMVFCFVQNFFFGQHERSNIYLFCRAKREFFFQNSTLGYMTKTLNQIIIFFLHQNQNILSSNIGKQNIFLEKKHNPPLKLNGRSLNMFKFKNIWSFS